MAVPNLLFALLLIVQGPPISPPAAVPPDWASYPEVDRSIRTGISPEVTMAVIELHRTPGCRVPSLSEGWRGVRVEIALLVAPDGRILDVESRSPACGRIRNHAARIMRRAYEGRLRPVGTETAQWQRTDISFAWQG